MLAAMDTIMTLVDMQTRLMPSIHNREALERNTAALIRGCKLLGVQIAVLHQYTKGLGETVPALQEALGDYCPIEKLTFSACQTEEYIQRLEFYNETCVIVAGVEAHICVQMTVLDLLSADYRVYVVADCIGSRKEVDIHYAIERMRQAGAIITTMESILFEMMGRADHPKRKAISGLITNPDS